MDEIAKRAKIGPGTLYRHFPTRDELLATVYIAEVEKLAAAQKKLSAKLSPIEALRAWLVVFIDYIAAKNIIVPALNAMACGPSRVFQQTTQVMEEAANALASRAVASDDLRSDIDPMDLLRTIYGLSTAVSADDWPTKAADIRRHTPSGLPPLIDALLAVVTGACKQTRFSTIGQQSDWPQPESSSDAGIADNSFH